jgi:dTDP-4-amino-4,6-dideoxygalactose transaminase
MPDEIAFFGGTPIFSRPLHIVRPQLPDPAQFIASFRDALASGQVTNNGRAVQEFEARLGAYLDTPVAVFCNGQTALMAMLRAADVAGGEVIVPSFTFSATPHAAVWAGAQPVFADIRDDGSFCLDPADVERRITPRTKAILGVDAYGLCCDYAALAEIGRRHGVKVLYDSAPSFGSRVNDRLVGGHGDGQMFSFHATKAFATMEGGCIASHDAALLGRVKAIRNFGQQGGADCDEAGLNGKMMEICALIGLEQLKVFEAAAAVRRQAVARMSRGLAQIPGLRLGQAPANQAPIWLYLPVLVDREAFGIDRERLAAVLEREGLFVRKYYSPPCHHMGAYAAVRSQSLPVTEHAAYNVLALPVYNDMTDQECDGIVAAFARIQRNAARIAATAT